MVSRSASSASTLLAALALACNVILSACLPASLPSQPSPSSCPVTHAPDPSPLPSRTPTATFTPSPSPPTVTPTPTSDPRFGVWEAFRDRVAEIIRTSTDRHLRLVVRPLDAPQFEINFGGDDVQRSASTIKALILIYALFKDPDLDLSGWSTDRPAADAYRMIVSSHNGATARVLVSAVGGRDHRDQALNAFNDFIHMALGVPESMGLTRWNYWPTSGVETDRLAEPVSAQFPEGIPNPITLNALVDFFELLETPAAIEEAAVRAAGLTGYADLALYPRPDDYEEAVLAAVDRAKALMSIPDPDYVTQMDRALEAARQSHPGVEFQMYGKNGTISPQDWSLRRWHVNEVVVVTASDGHGEQKCIIAFSSGTFYTDALLGAALDYCVALLETL